MRGPGSSDSLVARRALWVRKFAGSTPARSTMKPLGISIRSNDEGYSVNKARHRRWETAEINAALVDLDADPFDLEIDELCGCHECAWGWVADEPSPILPVTLLDAYKAKGGR